VGEGTRRWRRKGRRMMTRLPVGGSAGSSHEHGAAIDQYADYLTAVPSEKRPRPFVPAIREMFRPTSAQVCAALRQSHELWKAAA